MNGGIYLLRGDDDLVAMQEQPYDSEALLHAEVEPDEFWQRVDTNLKAGRTLATRSKSRPAISLQQGR